MTSFEIRTDAYSYIAGNPNLTPACTHNIQLSYSYGQKLMARLSYSHTSDMIINAPVVKDGDTRFGLMPVNFGQRRSFTGMANYRVSPVKR
ncbi:MAG: outer membrane beta-barrel family protein, partial [Tannerella sp.]|nr:outer membrane beta-barrel family protein [Tannerella sp.]